MNCVCFTISIYRCKYITNNIFMVILWLLQISAEKINGRRIGERLFAFSVRSCFVTSHHRLPIPRYPSTLSLIPIPRYPSLSLIPIPCYPSTLSLIPRRISRDFLRSCIVTSIRHRSLSSLPLVPLRILRDFRIILIKRVSGIPWWLLEIQRDP